MHITKVTQNLKVGDKVNQKTNHVFVFLEIFAHEGGIQSYIKDIFRAYLGLSQAYKAEVFLLRDSPDRLNLFEAENLKFHYFKNQSPHLGRLQMTAALLKCLLQNRPQQVFCGHINLAVLIQTLCQPLGIPYTVLTYGKEVWEPLKNQERRALTSADKIWTISRYSRDRACLANGLNPKMVEMMPCAIDGDKFTPGSKQPEFVQKYGLTGSKVLMTVARLWSGDIYKGVDVTIRALPQIAQVFPQVKYLIIGRGDDQPRLAQLAKDLGVSDRVVFAGFVATEELMEHYRLADAYIMPSQEGFGIVYLEAMACGVPVLSGDDDGSADPLQDGKLGWRVPHRNPDAVAAACIEMLQGDDQRCDGQWLREQAIALFGIDAFQQHLQKMLLSSVLSPNNK
ncbi:glycosyltransferase family 4 protein [Nostoc muscorum FACHB-395]|jgi:glycosyltransferase involved in cell wall biosynthesis|uniref:glycosyltransferase family 4 protein n=1 Tax=Nostoc sp. C057 TaxID=2576903 RepID=UPI0015C2F5F3|nr:glycosyltransferase family 4 protein [Nostoc sp. C057]MBD2509702.1 glycosyltransferase family 4 protein [Desmonostoc muscorum FACHB-395]QLE47493.1 glycosyltransferase family 4 protein [Nostoc sp. C057]